MNPNIPATTRKRVVIVGAGFGGIQVAKKISDWDEFQVVLIDRNNFHQFQPLYYQVATAGLEASSICFPLRKMFPCDKDTHIRITDAVEIHPDTKTLDTKLGPITYDYLVLATGADTNYFGMKNIQERALPMKTVSEAIAIRNRVLQNLEDALSAETEDERQGLMNIVVVGGGPTGVELCGTFAEMRKTVLPRDFPELNFMEMQIYLVEGGGELLGPMSVPSQEKSLKYIHKLGVNVIFNSHVIDFDGRIATIKETGDKLRTNTLVWAAGVKASPLNGLPTEVIGRGGRVKVNRVNQVEGFTDIFAIGDVAFMTEEKFPNGHPQVAQPAIQQGKLLARNLRRLVQGKSLSEFSYRDLGSMATIGRGLAVVDLPFIKFQGFLAWLTWLFVHLFAILGVKNRLVIFINWMWNYLNYDQALRLIIKPKLPKATLDAVTEKLADQVVMPK